MKYINGQRVGLTLGKFLPFHRGHELLIRTAHDICPLLVVLVGVSPDDKYSFEQRKAWILSCINPSADNQVLVIKQAELDKNAPKVQQLNVEHQQPSHHCHKTRLFSRFLKLK